MKPLRFCANLTTMFTETSSLAERYELAHRSGFSAVECAFPYGVPAEELQRVLAALGLKQVLINAEPGASLGFAAVVGKEAEFMESLRKSVEYCKTLQCKR